MRAITLGLLAAAASLTGACTEYGDGYGYGGTSVGVGYSNYDWDRPDPSYGGYYADRYYRQGRNYREYRLSQNDRVYRGRDGRYYCRRSDGTTGLIVGGLAGGLVGAALAPGGSSTLGALLGAAAGGALGSSADRNSVRCR